jgi:hypothetical protein
MTEYLPLLFLLACPIGMASMMFLPALGRLFTRRHDNNPAPSQGAG